MKSPVHSARDAAHDDGFDMGALLDMFVLHRRTMAVVFAVFAVAGVAWAVLSTPLYQSDILVQVEDNDTTSAARSALGELSSMFGVKASAETEKQVIGSRFVVSRAVDRQRLYVDARPARLPLIGGAIARANPRLSNPGLLGFGGYTWGDERIDIAAFDVPKTFEGERYMLTALPDGRFAIDGPGLDGPQAGRIGERTHPGMDQRGFTLQVDAIHARPGARFSLVRYGRLETIDRLQRALSIAEVGKDSNVLRVRLRGEDPVRITVTLNDIAHFYVDQNAARKAAEAARSLEFLEGQLPQLRSNVDASEAALTKLRTGLRSVDIEGEAKVLLQESADNDTQLVQIRQKRAELLTRFTSAHESVQAMDEQIAVLTARSAELGKRVAVLPERQREIVRLERDLKVDNELYVGLLDNIEQLKLLRASRIGNIRVIDLAEQPDRPVRYRRVLGLVAGIALGAFMAMVAAYGRRLLSGALSDPIEIERETGLRVAATIPLSPGGSGRLSLRGRARPDPLRPLAVSDPGDPAIESLRSLRATLEFSTAASGRNVVMITGPSPGIGKSFVASNLATVLAAGGRRVVLVDSDLRRGKLHRTFGTGEAGLAEVLAGTATLDAALRETGHGQLDFLPAGAYSADAADLFNDRRLRPLMAELSARYDIVVLDTAPLLPVADAATLATFAAGNVYVVARAGATGQGELQVTADRLAQVGADISGVILNGVDPHAGRFRYGMKYGAYRYDARRSTNGAAARRAGTEA
ncbi:polysaccharide biosynthesis tyrosine autokinase [Burkholderia sp. BE12]|uniref:polysaccharide biosynthesis tyrosine autokinase n=1 Tax=Burkholderia sp. BE12 TaxID=2082394 RepID=UPI000CF562F2|nr:polysaccharide biosynthesis tyrosine autokinase [Burkholderia sp. BE12]